MQTSSAMQCFHSPHSRLDSGYTDQCGGFTRSNYVGYIYLRMRTRDRALPAFTIVVAL